MFECDGLILLYKSSLKHGDQSYEILDFFTHDQDFSLEDQWHFYEKKYLLSAKGLKVLSFETYEELESYGLFVAQDLQKVSLYILDNMNFNEALFHSGTIEAAFGQILKCAKKITLDIDGDPKSGLFGRIFRA